MAPPTYIISRVADPIFAVVIGLGAAALRINREEKEKAYAFPTITNAQLANLGRLKGLKTIKSAARSFMQAFMQAVLATKDVAAIPLAIKSYQMAPHGNHG
ncbi:hypothetical protein NUW58_g2076 [Xylaria curta]|uniref:Uncharacterized protein n=1 Tax=Xylaria curta TaxID=42375 RepID=A0ACC1PKK8_9PEZI|nr:hypothetical protein NUW58_g2076 [Xylaria curta]